MLRSMFSAISGLRAHQEMMDVTGNNISNVNTTGYKASRTTFQETFAQMTRGGTAGVPGDANDDPPGAGGQNPMQIGLGAQVAGIDMTFTQGAAQSTGRATDLAIEGEGFFVVESGDGEMLSRAGAFTLDNEGQLVGPSGERVMGVMNADLNDDGSLNGEPAPMEDTNVDITGTDDLEPVVVNPGDFTDVSIDARGIVSARDADGNSHEIAQLAMARVPNNQGLQREAGGLYQLGGGAAGEVQWGTAGENGLGDIQAGTLEMSNVDLAQEFTNLILSQRGFQANSRTITTSDELLQELVNLKR